MFYSTSAEGRRPQPAAAPWNPAQEGRRPINPICVVRSRWDRLFAALDCLFLIAIGVTSVATMHLSHMLGWSFLVEMLVGMSGAMIVQMGLAVMVAPLLGSIESAVPSMVVAMTAPMVLCGAHMLGCSLEWPACLAMGSSLGIASFAILSFYGACCRRRYLGFCGGEA
jgi:hypothetical protein